MGVPLFHNEKLNLNPWQDPLGHDAHQGLERFLSRFTRPGVPSHTIITDPDFYVFLWFHNAVGNLIQCPYVDESYTPFLESQTKSDIRPNNIGKRNEAFINPHQGIQGGVDDSGLALPFYCIDLTPFIVEATLPEIQPANSEKIQTLFGETSAGAFSPYASDGQKSITFTVLDTEYSILDALFYPWMKDINSPWWYKEDAVWSEWATPYPMATLEIQRPRMRYMEEINQSETYTPTNQVYYSYKYLGVKPTSYTTFELNGDGRTSLTRTLTLVADMCLVDLTNDIRTTTNESENLGVRTKLLFGVLDKIKKETVEVVPEEKKEELEQAQNDYSDVGQEEQQVIDEIQQQENGQSPGQDAGEQPPDLGAASENNPYMSDDEAAQANADAEALANEQAAQNYLEEQGKMDLEGMPETSAEAKEDVKEEKGFFDSVMDTMKGVGSGIMDGAKTAGGWIADGISGGIGLATDAASGAVGLAADVSESAIKGADGVLGSALGAAGNLTSSVLGAASSVLGGSTGASAQNNGGVGGLASNLGTALGSVGKSASGLLEGIGSAISGNGSSSSKGGSSTSGGGGLFGSIGKMLDGAATGVTTAFGVVSGQSSSSSGLKQSSQQASSDKPNAVQNSASNASTNATMIGGLLDKGLSKAFSAVGDVVGYAGNQMGGAGNKLSEMIQKVASGNPTTDAQRYNVQAQGAAKQQAAATQQVRENNLLTRSIDKASKDISESVNAVSWLTSGAINLTGKGVTYAVDGLGTLVNKIGTGLADKPSPIETYVGMVTKEHPVQENMA